MPTLSDSLDALRAQSEQIAYLSSLNARPAGPFVQAYLGLPTAPRLQAGNVLDLIRDAQDSERRLFKFVGESDAPGTSIAGGGGGNKRVEKREGGVVTPLKELKRRGGSKDDTEVMLRTAMKLVDDDRPMPRARAHIINLLDAHHQQVERLAELERLIAEATNPRPSRQPSPPPASSGALSPRAGGESTSKAKLSPEEAIKAEEAALKALEASLQSLRRAAVPRQTPSATSSPSKLTSPASQQQNQIPQTPFGTRTPARSTHDDTMKTPGREMPHVTNSLVNGTTPRRIDRFSPLKFLGTPRAPLGGSALRNPIGGEEEGRRTIFGRASSGLNRSTSGPSRPSQIFQTPAQGSTLIPTPHDANAAPTSQMGPTPGSPDDDVALPQGEDETIRLPRPGSPAVQSPMAESDPPAPVTPEETTVLEEEPAEQTPKAATDPADKTGPKRIGGVEVELEGVKAGIAKIWTTLGEMMRQGVTGGQVGQDVESSLKHLHHLSQSDPPPPPSPSNSSSSSLTTAAGGATGKPVTTETILFAHLFLMILRSFSLAEEASNVAGVDMNEVKDTLTSLAKAGGWDTTGAGGLGTKIIYAAVGKRTVRIDRKGGGSGRVRFAE